MPSLWEAQAAAEGRDVHGMKYPKASGDPGVNTTPDRVGGGLEPG